MFCYDMIYKKFDIEHEFLKYFQTEEVQRLHRVSQSAIPPVFQSFSGVASRFEHSVGVFYLASKVSELPDFVHLKKSLPLAALFHDVGHPPFSHLTEGMQKELTGMNHEEFASEVLKKNIKKLLEDDGISFAEVKDLIEGKRVFGELLNGSIDIDNLDNVLRFGMGTGITGRMYEPEKIATSFRIHGDKLFMNKSAADEIKKWHECRREIYNYVYSDQNLAPGTMLRKALDLGFESGNIDKDFLYLDDFEALKKLRTFKEGEKIMSRLFLWKFPENAFKMATSFPSREIINIANNAAKRLKIEREIEEDTKTRATDFGLLAIKMRTKRIVHLNYLDEKKESKNGEKEKDDSEWLLTAYAYNNKEKIREFLSSLAELKGENIAAN